MDQTASQGDGHSIAGRILRRRTILRERDYKKLVSQALDCGYHRTSWQPMTYDAIHKETMWRTLQGENFSDNMFFSTREERWYNSLSHWQKEMLPVLDNKEKFMRMYIHWLKDSKRLYNPNWQHWSWQVEDDTVKLRWYSNKPYETLGVATLERDY